MRLNLPKTEACLNCSRYSNCNNPKKSFSYYCDKYKPMNYAELEDHLSYNKTSKKTPKNIDKLLDDDELTEEFNISRIVNQVLNSKSIVPIDIKINDRDLPRAKNFFEFCTGEDFLKVKPFLWQSIVGTILNSEFCPNCTDMNWLLHDHEVTNSLKRFKKRVALLEYGECPYCGIAKSKLVKNGDINHYQELIAVCGQRAGKSALTAMLSAYHIHRYTMLGKPNEVYSLLHSSISHMNFVAMSFSGAKNLLYDPLFGYLSEAPWFCNYHEILKDYERRTGESIFKLNDTFLMYRHRALVVAPLGPDRRSLRGKTRFGAAIDEICHMPNDNKEAVKMNATEVYVALERSLLTIRAASNKLLAKGFNNIPTGLFFNISSPFSVRDKGMELLRASTNSKKIYGIQKATWELNPTVTMEDLKSEFDKDEVTAMRDYGAQPPLQSNAFITSEAHVQSCMTGKKSNAIKLSFAQKRYKNNDAERYAKITHIGKCNYPSVLAFDAGVVNNSFSFVCGHMDEEDENFVPTIITEIMPLPGIPLNFTLIYENVITEIIESQNVVLVTADRWNSIKILSDIRQQFDIQTEQYSLKYKDMWFAKNYITEGKIILPKCEKAIKECIEYDIDNYPYAFENKPLEHLILQMLTVRDTGNAVIKGDGNLTDDIFRALCLALHRIKDPKHEELFAQAYEETTNFSPGHLAVVRGGSNTATASSVSLTASSGRVLAVSRRSKS